MLRNQPLEPHVAGRPEQIRTDLALLEWRQLDAINAPTQQPGKIVLAQVQRQRAHVLAIADQDSKGVEFDFLVMLPAVQAVEI